MRVSVRFAVAVLIIAVGMSTLSLSATGLVEAQTEQQYLLLGSDSTLPANLDALVASVGGRLIQSFDQIGVAVASSSEAMFMEAAAALPGIQAVVPDAVAYLDQPVAMESFEVESVVAEEAVAEGVTSVPTLHKAQWNMIKIQARQAWETGALGQGVKVAVLDSGIDYRHRELAGQVDMTLSKSFVKENTGTLAPFADLSLHGTHVAGIIAGKGIAPGVAPQAKLIAVKVLDKDGVGDESNVIAGILDATDKGTDVINMSLGFRFVVNDRASAQQLAALNRAVNYAHSRGVVVVASSGNRASDLDRNRNEVKAPAQITHVVAVSGTGQSDELGSYSDYGSSTIYVAAPGTRIFGPCNTVICVPRPVKDKSGKIIGFLFGYIFGTGTSQAAAHVSGLAALVKSSNPGLSAAQIRSIVQKAVEDLGKPGRDEFYGFGRINAYRAVTRK